ncbi:hypothetical protein TRFO_06239 [Tritrichomonas foetus]|uniref:Uncharacterized protein n=1 Tax=Tritrichomonas foetus TaxID=1144522 RepID=A0A1J4K1W9_9EUKA|nr:hypothetical protein TRFO_06239 [Tritrichomonas foetus]|eukprot:OHT04784.1 hypothetical protein TRFO_06239 [Tritrichomonas foetus]
MTNSQPVAETFQAELAAINEKGKELKGEKRENYRSIVQRLENNCQVLADLREEHTSLREKLGQLVKEKNSRSNISNLDSALKHTNHEVNLLKRQIDGLKHQKEQSVRSQRESEVILANFKRAETSDHPEEQRIHDMKNRLDKANIKNSETTHLMKLYQQIITLFDKQKTHWNPILQQKQAEIARKQKDIADLTLIARDSMHSLSIASSDYARADTQCNNARQKRDASLNAKKEQAKVNNARQVMETDLDQKASKPQPSLNSQPSVLRNKMNKAAREKREERFRQVSSVYEDIRDRFGTNEPEKIQNFFAERKETTQTLQKQIDELKEACDTLERKSGHLKAALEESEYASAKGVGGSRLLAEGKRIPNSKREELLEERKLMAAMEVHQKSVKGGVIHLAEVMNLVQSEGEELPPEPENILKWCNEKCSSLKDTLNDEDEDFTAMINKQAFVSLIARTEVDFDMQRVDSKRVIKKPFDQHKRAPKEKTGDIQTRVLDRNQVKVQAQKAFQLSQQNQRRANKT